jgi:UDP-N-acetylmuramate-alanine ligase
LNTVAASAATSYLAAHLRADRAVQVAAVHGYTTAFTVSAALLAAAALAAGVLVRASRHHVLHEVVIGDPVTSASELIAAAEPVVSA